MSKSMKLVIVGCIMFIVAVVFFIYALNHPEFNFPWSNTITYTGYLIYLAIMAGCFISGAVLKITTKRK